MPMDENSDLNHLFLRARQENEPLPDALALRILADAETVRLQRLQKSPQGFWAQALDSFFGWQGMGGLAAAGIAGIWIGLTAPAFLPDPATLLYSQSSGFEVADMDLNTIFLEEGE
ncbi:hypothetical protein [Ruegeria faecimaris]|uniref:hypothetical protein n=2 Tax=Ruegeria faecimaris TaxID=686389 RepID=UPI0024908929|nr:hypothetical protein [Ruegeria faecimaris]